MDWICRRCACRPAAAARFDPPSGGMGPRRGLRLTSPAAIVPFERRIRMSPGIDQNPAASNRGPVPAISALVWLSLSALAAGCSGGGGSTPTAPTTPSSTSTITFRVDGVATTATSVTATVVNGTLTIGGTDSSRNTTIGLAVTASGAGTYALGPLSPANAQLYVGNPVV